MRNPIQLSLFGAAALLTLLQTFTFRRLSRARAQVLEMTNAGRPETAFGPGFITVDARMCGTARGCRGAQQ